MDHLIKTVTAMAVVAATAAVIPYIAPAVVYGSVLLGVAVAMSRK